MVYIGISFSLFYFYINIKSSSGVDITSLEKRKIIGDHIVKDRTGSQVWFRFVYTLLMMLVPSEFKVDKSLWVESQPLLGKQGLFCSFTKACDALFIIVIKQPHLFLENTDASPFRIIDMRDTMYNGVHIHLLYFITQRIFYLTVDLLFRHPIIPEILVLRAQCHQEDQEADKGNKEM